MRKKLTVWIAIFIAGGTLATIAAEPA